MTMMDRIYLRTHYKNGLYYWKVPNAKEETPEDVQAAIDEVNEICRKQVCAPMEFVIEHFPEYLHFYTTNVMMYYDYVEVVVKDPKKLNKAIRAYAKA